MSAKPKRSSVFPALGPGLVTGASDDDPSGIATYAQAGAQFGYQLGWTLVLTYPLMCAIQEISARIGRVTGRGIAGNLRRRFGPVPVYGVITLLLVANIVNLGADLGAMAAVLQLLAGGPAFPYVLAFGVLSAGLEIYVSYAKYTSILKWVTMSLLAYVAVVAVVQVDWAAAASGAFLPHIGTGGGYLTTLVAILGTTISPYLFFWQAESEVEQELETPGSKPLREMPAQAGPELKRIRIDTYLGMGISNIIAVFIIIATAATLHAKGVTHIETAADAAEALRPIAGPFAFLVFALGIIGSGLLAVPVLAGSAAYALGEVRQWPVGLARRPLEAKRFYGVIAVGILAGVALNLTSIPPMKALYWSAVINGVIAVPLIPIMLLMASSPRVMGTLTISTPLKIMGWITALAMGLSVIGMAAL